jgi:tol-pal system protein YbgF
MMPPMIFRRLALPLILALIATTAVAQTPMDPLDARDARRLDRMEQVMRELRSIVFQGRDSGQPVIVQPAETDYQLQEVTRRMTELEQSITRLTGELETANRNAEVAQRDVQALRAETKTLTDRLTSLETRSVAVPTMTDTAPGEGDLAGAPPPSGQTSAEAFTEAYQLMMSGDYAAAEGAFQDYVARYGDTPRAAEARYWLGKTLSARSAHADAAGAYIGAIRGWPATNWAPDAVVELSRALIALKKPADACQTLAELNRRYPKATAPVKSRAASARTQAKCAA